MNKIYSLIIALAASLALSGCVTVTKLKDEDRTRVRFANARAAQVFYEAALLPHGPNRNGRGMACIGGWSPISVRTTETKNVSFNKAVRTADTNRDGLISQSEAEKFAAAQPKTDLPMAQ
jgi:hypothetical protein